jgi:hypothetical protein
MEISILPFIILFSIIIITIFILGAIFFYNLGIKKGKISIKNEENEFEAVTLPSYPETKNTEKKEEKIDTENDVLKDENSQHGIFSENSSEIKHNEIKETGKIEKKDQRWRFLKYTSRGYIYAKEDKDAGALRWR